MAASQPEFVPESCPRHGYAVDGLVCYHGNLFCRQIFVQKGAEPSLVYSEVGEILYQTLE